MYKVVFLLSLLMLSCGSDTGMGPEPEPEPTEPMIPDHTKGDLVIPLPGGVKMAFIWIEPGTFSYGTSNPSGPELLQSEQTIDAGFYLGKYEVTQKQWFSVMGTRPWQNLSGESTLEIGDDFPAGHLSRNEVSDFIRTINRTTEDNPYTMPTEIQWEYACRAGTTTTWHFGNADSLLNQYAWYEKNSGNQAHIVGTKLPNDWGLYDMHGNVMEWTFDPTLISPIIKDQVSAFSQYNPPHGYLRGGAFSSPANLTKCASRFLSFSSNAGSFFMGFRLLRRGPKIHSNPQ